MIGMPAEIARIGRIEWRQSHSSDSGCVTLNGLVERVPDQSNWHALGVVLHARTARMREDVRVGVARNSWRRVQMLVGFRCTMLERFGFEMKSIADGQTL
jgi:hypothetical protein